MSEHLFSDRAYKDIKGKLKLDIEKLSKLKVEIIKFDSKLKTCVRVSTDNLFRGNILDFPIIDVIVNDRFVEITGLILGKIYSGLILNLEYMNENKFYLLEDFKVEAGDIISEYICNTYKLAFNRNVTEEEFNEWYFNIQQGSENINKFIEDVTYSDEFLEVNDDLNSFIKVLHKLIFRRDISEDNLNYWINKYNEKVKDDTDKNAKHYLIDQMCYYKQFEYIMDNNKSK